MSKLKSDFIGKGSMKEFVEESNAAFSSLSNVSFTMPDGYSGIEPTVYIKDGRLTFDFGQSLIFTLNNVVWNVSGSADVPTKTADVDDGKLNLTVVANNKPIIYSVDGNGLSGRVVLTSSAVVGSNIVVYVTVNLS
jgi:hypothetical protein